MSRVRSFAKSALLILLTLVTYAEVNGQCANITPSFSVNATGCGIPRNYTFTNSSTGVSNGVATYIWRHGSTVLDTTVGTGSSPTLTINSPGTDTVWLVAIDTNGCRDSVMLTTTTTTTANTIFDPSTGTFNYSPLWQNCILFLASPDSFRIDVLASGTLTNYYMIWGDGSADSGASLTVGNSVSHNYTSLGTYNVQIVSQNGSCYDTVNGQVINERIPTAGIIGPPAGGNVGCAPYTVRFINNSFNVSSNTQFRWTMGDGTTYILPSSTSNDTLYHTYTDGVCNGVVSVEAFNDCGSSTATWTPIYINDEDDASFTVNTTNCDPSLPFTFLNTSTNNYCTPSTRLFYWDFGDGTNTGWINTTIPQNHTFPQAGAYTVRLIDSNQCGTDTFEYRAVINFTPDPGFIYSATNGCGPLEVRVADTTAGIGNIRLWTFGNGVTSGDSIDTAYYITPGSYTLQLTVSNICGTVSESVPITVWSPPNAVLGTIASGCEPLNVSFQNNSTYFNDSTVSYYWDFGDGTSSTAKDPPDKIYSTPGTYTVKLVVNDTCGSDSVTRTFTVHPKPVAGFSSDTVCQGAANSFTDTSSVLTGSISSRSWTFGSPSQGTSTATNPSFTFNAADSFPTQLIVVSNNGCRDTVINEAIVWANPNTSWAVSPNDSVCIGNVQSFDGTASSGSGTIASYSWDFGNGTGSSQEDTVITYPAAGSYSVKFKVINTLGCADSSIGTITVLPLPVIQISADTACVGSATTFQDLSTVSLGTIDLREWDLDNNGSFDSTGQTTTYVYSSLGSRWVRLRVTTVFGCQNLDSTQITVHPLPVPAISVDSSTICMGDSITVTNTTTGASTYTFDFGDGTVVSVSNTNAIKHAYSDSGTYTVRMYAYSDRSCVDSTNSIVVVRPTPLAQFTVNQQIACAPFNFVFTNTSERSTDYIWFSDGIQTSTALNRADTLISLDSQAFTIRLVAMNNSSCPSDTTELEIGTSRNPIADFQTNPDSGCGPLTVAFGNTSQFASSYFWQFNNGTTSTASDTSVQFSAAAVNDSTYTISLIAFNWQGCSDTIQKDIVVHPNPSVSFTQTNTDSCGPLTVSFSNTSVHNAGGTQTDMNFVWNYGNGNTSTAVDSVIEYIASSTIDSIYTVQLIGYSIYGCPDTAVSQVTVYPNPVASFTMSQADSCGPFGVQFTNTSVPNNGGAIGVMSFQWDLGNGSTPTTQDPSTQYAASLTQDSTYSIQLIAFSEHGCPDTATNTVRAYPKASASYTQSDTSGCGPLDVVFTNTSLPFDTSTIADMTFEWDFGNGVSSTAQDTTVRFISAAAADTVYTVTLIAYTEHGCADTFTSTVRVHPGPVAQFTVNHAVACAPATFSFTNTSINSNNFYWMVDGVVSSNETTRSDTIILQDTSIALIGLIAETSFGCPNDTTEMYIGTSRNPIADFQTNPDSGCGPLTVAFGNTSQFASSFYWDFKNGITSTASDTSVQFTAASVNDSTYTIQLVAYNWQGCPDTTEKDIVVHPNPSVSFTQTNTDSCGPLTVSFSNTSVHNAGGSQADMTFAWDFGNGQTSTAVDTQAQFIASSTIDTVYTIQLIGYSRYGCPDTAVSQVTVYPNPVASFTMSQADSCGPFGVQFTNTSVPNNGGAIGVMSFQWDLGNGTSSTSQDASAQYTASLTQDSIYTIELIAFSEHGCPDTATNTVRAYPKASASYTQSDTSGCGPLDVVFTNTSQPFDTSTIADMTFEWDFGNGQTSTTQDNTITFVAASLNDTVYTVTLIAYTEHGCADTFTSTVRVHPKPSVSLTKDDSTGCDPVTVNFTGSGVNVATYHWDFKDGSTSNLQNPSHDFRAVPFYDTTYYVSLVGESPYGCTSDTVLTDVSVLGNPLADFTVLPDSVCASTTSQMINNSLGAITYFWDFGNGDTSSAVSPQALFDLNPSADTTYFIQLIATNTVGCMDTATGYVVVSPSPTAQFTLDIDTGCSPVQVQFTDQSTFASFYAWSFGNGLSDTVANPSSVFRNSGTVDSVYRAQLIVTNLGGCSDTAFADIRVYPQPSADFVASPSSGCGDLSVTLNNQSTPNDTGSINDMTFAWTLGNGSTSTAVNPSTSYPRSLTQDSLFTVQLIGTSEHGCRDTVVKNVRTFPRPSASFTQSDTSGCGPLTISFANTSIPNDTGNISIMSFVWNFGNGFISYDQNDTVTFYPALTQDTVYTVRLIAISEHGCRDTTYSTVRVHPDPTGTFSLNPSSGCGPLTVNFTSTSQNATSYFWDFGNGSTSSSANPSSVYQNRPDFDTTYTVKFAALSQYSCPSDTVTRTVTVRPDPVAAFSQSTDSICGTTNIFFTNQTTGANSYSWDFGDGSTSASANPQHSFAMNPTADTTYTVRLIANNFFGCTDTTFGSVTIYPFPTAVITSNTDNGCTPLAVTFGHSSLLGTSYAWDFGNGQTSTSETPLSSFSNSTLYDTVYSVKLVVTSNRGCLDSTTAPIRVYPLPTASFTTVPSTGCGDLSVTMNNQSTPNDTGSISIMSFQWDLGNGSTSTSVNPSTSYSRSLIQDSVYTISLIATSEHGCLDTTDRSVVVFPKPDAVFTQSDTSGCGPLTINFTNNSVPFDTGSIANMTFQWDFGNGQISTSQDPSIVFQASLIQDTVYTVRLISFSEHGCRDTAYSTVRVHPNPQVAYTQSPSSGCGPLDVSFTSTTLNVGTYYWDFGDGDTSSQANPSHEFQNQVNLDRSYTVQLWAQSIRGCWSDTVSSTVIVRPDPIADFNSNLDSLCGGGSVQFSNVSQLGYSYEWDFGDGSATSTTVNPQHNFSEIAFTDTAYDVRLIATSVYGCKDTLIKPLTVFPLPEAQITFTPDSGCSPLSVFLGNTSTIAQSHFWELGNGDTNTADTFTYVFDNPLGIDYLYQVIASASTVHGCIDKDTVEIRVHPLPRPNFLFSKTGICDTSEYNFTNISAGAVNYSWDFGDGTGSNQTNPSHIYPTAVSNDTNFTATLIATTNRGCVDSISKPITVTPILLARASTNGAMGCPPLAVDFVNNSTNASTYYWEFDDGFVSIQANPSHTFINPDPVNHTYNVRLIVNNNFGCADTAIVPVTVLPNIDASFVFSKSARCDVAEYTFQNLSVGAASYSWDFGDGSTSNATDPSHIFPASLTQDSLFTVRLIVQSSGNCYDTFTQVLRIHPVVVAQFSVDNNNACSYMVANFTNESRNGRFYVWDFGDGTGSAVFSPSHPYTQVGTFLPSLIVYDINGCSDTFTLANPINIYETPIANFIATPSTSRLPQSTFDFLDLSVTSSALTYDWNFGEPSSANNTSALQNPSHTYADSGTYTITLIVDNGNCKDTIVRTVRVEYYFPIASFIQDPDTGCMPHTVTFTNQSQYADSYQWFFGDGGQSTDENPVYTYKNPGSYTVTLIARGPGGVDDTTKIDVIIVIQKPYANFYTNPVVAWLPNTEFNLINTSLLATSYQWEIVGTQGSSVITTDPNPIIDLNQEGEYTIRLIAINDYGCRDTLERPNYLRVNADGVVLVPDAFTPNADGTNDLFKPVFDGVQRDGYTFKVYNRWGELMFETHDIDEAWDGTFAGVPCESEVYIWQVQCNLFGGQRHEEKGRVTLLR